MNLPQTLCLGPGERIDVFASQRQEPEKSADVHNQHLLGQAGTHIES